MITSFYLILNFAIVVDGLWLIKVILPGRDGGADEKNVNAFDLDAMPSLLRQRTLIL